MFERYTESARRALFFSRYEATELGSVSIDTVHLLLGLLREPKGIVARLLAESKISPDEVVAELKAGTEFVEKLSSSIEIPFTESGRQALEFAVDEANRLRHGYVGTEHLLLALVREERSLAGSVLRRRGLLLPRVRDDLVRLMKTGPGSMTEVSAGQVIERIDELITLLQNFRGSLPDDEAQQLVERVLGDLQTLKRRL